MFSSPYAFVLMPAVSLRIFSDKDVKPYVLRISYQLCNSLLGESADPRMRTPIILHSKKRTTCSGLMKTALNNVLLPTLFKVVNNTEQVDEPELACNQV